MAGAKESYSADCQLSGDLEQTRPGANMIPKWLCLFTLSVVSGDVVLIIHGMVLRYRMLLLTEAYNAGHYTVMLQKDVTLGDNINIPAEQFHVTSYFVHSAYLMHVASQKRKCTFQWK